MRFKHLHELNTICTAESKTIAQLMIEEQVQETNTPEADVVKQMSEYYQVMKEAVRKGLTEDTTSRSGLTGGDGKKWPSTFARVRLVQEMLLHLPWRMPCAYLK